MDGCSIQAAEETETKKLKEEIARLKQEKDKAEREAAEGPLKDGSQVEVAPPSMHDFTDDALDSKSNQV